MTALPWQAFAFGSAFFAALTAIFGKIGVSEINSNTATWIRTLIILAITTSVVLYNNQWVSPSEIPSRTLIFLGLSGVATGLSWLCYYRALQMAPASQVAPIDKLSVAIAIVFAILFLGESFSWKIAVGGTLITLGSLVLAL